MYTKKIKLSVLFILRGVVCFCFLGGCGQKLTDITITQHLQINSMHIDGNNVKLTDSNQTILSTRPSIKISFSEPVNKVISEGKFTLREATGSNIINLQSTYDLNEQEVTITFRIVTENLKRAVPYIFTIDSLVTSQLQKTLARSYRFYMRVP